MERVDCVVIGAGVVGLAAARALARAGREVLIVEAEDIIGGGVSSRSSEVIHAGLYYPPGSLKALCCVEGRRRLYDFCAARQVPFRRCGKLVVATSEPELDALWRLAKTACQNGVSDLRGLTEAEVRQTEPELRCVGALLSPASGIVDSHAFMVALLAEAEAHGAVLARRTRLQGGAVTSQGLRLRFSDDFSVQARLTVNAAGLAASEVARSLEGVPAAHVPRTYFAKGRYFALAGRAPFSHLVYPLPEPGGLGVHLTLDLAGQARFGPDVQWVETPDYTVDLDQIDAFSAAVRRYWPGLPAGRLEAAYAGVRPKLAPAGAPAADFRIEGPSVHGVDGLINLFGIESPGLTASLAIAERIVAAAQEAA